MGIIIKGKPTMPILEDLSGLATDYLRMRAYRDLQPTPTYAQTPTVQPAFLDVPGVDIIRDREGEKGYVYDPNADCGRGKWIKKRRRRRKRLATKSDKADLAALKGILGSGKLLEVWIATHA